MKRLCAVVKIVAATTLVRISCQSDQEENMKTRRRPGMGSILGAVLVLVLGLGGVATAAQLVTSADIKNGTIRAADLSSSAKRALKADRGPRGFSGAHGQPGPAGPQGPAGPAGPAGGGQGVVTFDAILLDTDGSEGWGAWLDNTSGSGQYLVTEVYCASGDIWYDYTFIAGGQENGMGAWCDLGDSASSGGWYLTDSPPDGGLGRRSARRSSAALRAAIRR